MTEPLLTRDEALDSLTILLGVEVVRVVGQKSRDGTDEWIVTTSAGRVFRLPDDWMAARWRKQLARCFPHHQIDNRGDHRGVQIYCRFAAGRTGHGA